MAGEEEWLVRLTKRTLTMICDLSIALMESNDLFDDPIVEEKTVKNYRVSERAWRLIQLGAFLRSYHNELGSKPHSIGVNDTIYQR